MKAFSLTGAVFKDLEWTGKNYFQAADIKWHGNTEKLVL